MAADDSGFPLPGTLPSPEPIRADTPRGLQTPESRASRRSRPHLKTFGELARRITDVTSRVLITFLILAAGVSFGVQVLRWWRDSSPEQLISEKERIQAESRDARDLGRPAWFELLTGQGGLSAVSVFGNPAEAEKQAEELCLQMARNTAIPGTALGKEELELLERLKATTPVRSEGSDLQLFRCPGDFSLWAMVRRFSKEQVGGEKGAIGTTLTKAGHQSGNASAQSGDFAEDEGWRVVGWGMLIPAGGERWTLYLTTTSAGGRGSALAAAKMPQVGDSTQSVFEAPPGSRWTFRLSLSPGNWVGVFEETTSGSAATWPLFLDRNLMREGWHPMGEWLQEGHNTVRRYRREASNDQAEFLIVKRQRSPVGPERGVVIYFCQERALEFRHDPDDR